MAGKQVTIAQRFEAVNRRPTGFDYLRIILALGVIVWHAFPLSYGFKYAAGLAQTPLGSLQEFILPMFFALSGFLVAGSLERNSIITFVGLRIIRIAPALAVEVCLSALLLGPLLTTVPIARYLADDRFHQYFLNIVGDIHYLLPGVFHDNPYADIVNGQLWTVPWELKCYITLTLLAVFGVAKRRNLLLGASIVASVGLLAWHMHTKASAESAPLFIGFLAGVAIFRFRDVLPWDWKLGAIAGLAMALLLRLPQGAYFAGFPAAYFTVYIGLLNPKKIALLRGADYSYGLYLYGFVIQQAIANLFSWSHQWYWNLLLAVPGAALFAAFSWTFVEKPALRVREVLPFLGRSTPRAAT